jgi:hypothetical protein
MSEKTIQRRRLNGWERIGIVLSVLWFVGTFAYALNDHDRTADLFLSACRLDKSFDECWEETRPLRALSLQWVVDVLGLAIFGIFFGWLCVYVVVATVRWIMRGFSIQK